MGGSENAINLIDQKGEGAPSCFHSGDDLLLCSEFDVIGLDMLLEFTIFFKVKFWDVPSVLPQERSAQDIQVVPDVCVLEVEPLVAPETLGERRGGGLDLPDFKPILTGQRRVFGHHGVKKPVARDCTVLYELLVEARISVGRRNPRIGFEFELEGKSGV